MVDSSYFKIGVPGDLPDIFSFVFWGYGMSSETQNIYSLDVSYLKVES